VTGTPTIRTDIAGRQAGWPVGATRGPNERSRDPIARLRGLEVAFHSRAIGSDTFEKLRGYS